MDALTTRPWPPPPDIYSIRELVRAADPEGHLAAGAHSDEYEPEEDAIFTAIADLKTSDLLAPRILPLIEAIWQESFALDASAMKGRLSALRGLTLQIERFFGPESKPQLR